MDTPDVHDCATDVRGVTVASAAGVRGAKCVGALVCYVGLENGECGITYPDLLFGRSIIGGRGVMPVSYTHLTLPTILRV